MIVHCSMVHKSAIYPSNHEIFF